VSTSALLLAGCSSGVVDESPTSSTTQALLPGSVSPGRYLIVDQFGYATDMKKVAVLADPQSGSNSADAYVPGSSLQVRRWSDGVQVYSGPTTQWNSGSTQTSSGDRGWHFDFSSVATTGSYFIYDPTNNVRSHKFDIRDDVYADVLKAALRTFYYQRLNMAKTSTYAGTWTDTAAFMGTNQDSQARDFFNQSAPARDLSGGWMDAGDTNKYVTFATEPVHQLLSAYEENPGAFTSTHNIPESSNSIPDIIDELKYETDWLKKMQLSGGGVILKMGLCKPGVTGCPNSSGDATSPLSGNTGQRFYGRVCSSSTIDAAGMFAHAARVYRGVSGLSSEANDLQNRAAQAWNHYHNNTKSDACDLGEIRSGDADRPTSATAEANQTESAVVAAVHLFALTGNSVYNNFVKNNLSSTRPFRESSGNWTRGYNQSVAEALLYYTKLPGADSTTVNSINSRLTGSLNNSTYFKFSASQDLYRAHIEDSAYHWGSNHIRNNYGNMNSDVIIYNLDSTNAGSYEDRMVGILNHVHGVNPLNKVYLTSMSQYGAESSMSQIYHEWFKHGSSWDTNPAPGFVPGGPNASFCTTSSGADSTWPCWNDSLKTNPRQKVYRDFNTVWDTTTGEAAAWELTEPGIYYQASYVKLLSKFVGTGSWTTPAVPSQTGTCSDGVINRNETDVDCGGGSCGACASGKMCTAGSDCSSGTCTAGICAGNTDSADYSFESSTHSFTHDGNCSSLGTSTTRAFAGSSSLKCTMNSSSNAVSVHRDGPGMSAGSTITFRVWIPTGSGIDSVQPFIQDNAWSWTGNYKHISALTAGAWNTITVTVPSNASTPVQRVGVYFSRSSSWSGDVFIDSIDW
jgi:hypothetical protein